jgi:hypothetical protein
MGERMSAKSPRPGLAELAAASVDDEDVRVLQRVAAVYAAVDPVPSGLVDRIAFGMTLDALHAEIAELQRSGELVGVRSSDSVEAQSVTFTSSNLTTMVTISVVSADRVRIDGWAAPGRGLSVELRVGDQSMQTTADEDGRFVFEDVPRGLAQFVLRPASVGGQPPVITPAIEI